LIQASEKSEESVSETANDGCYITEHTMKRPRAPKIIDKVIGCVVEDDPIQRGKTLIVQYKGKSTFSKIQAKKMKEVYPQDLIEFYERQIIWK
jgi:Chromo shadow domain